MDDKLDGWKEISQLSKRSIRTLQRWRVGLGFPVQSLFEGKRAPVIGSRSEINKWLRGVAALPEVEASADSPAVAETSGQPTVALQQLLKLYYREEDLKARGLFRFSLATNAAKIETNIVTKRCWLETSVALDERDGKRFPLVPPTFSWPTTSKTAVTRSLLQRQDTNLFHT